MNKTLLEKAVRRLDELLRESNHTASFIVCGGGALILQGLITRDTNDLDVVSPTISQEILPLISQVAKELKIDEHWLNHHADSLTKELPVDWKMHIVLLYRGTALEIFGLSRMDMLRSKFWAYCDRSDDLDDLMKLAPTQEELHNIIEWTLVKDGNPDWGNHVEIMATKLRKKLGHE